MNKIYIIISTISGLSTVLGTIPIFIKKLDKNKMLSYSLGLSFSTMFLISILELSREGLLLVKDYNKYLVFISSLLLELFGMSIVKYINKKIESKEELYRVGILNMIALLIHNIPEGIIVTITLMNNIELGIKMTLLIMIHNIPEGMSISFPIYASTNNKRKSFYYTLLSGLGELTGTIISILLLKKYITNIVLYVIYMITSGIMIYLSITKILFTGIKLDNKKNLYIGIITGIIIVAITI